MNKQLFAEYANLEAQIRTLEETQSGLRTQIVGEMETAEFDQVKSEYGTFSFTVRKTWKYPEGVKVLEDAVRTAKKTAESDNTATATEVKSLTFRPIKATVDAS